MPVCPACGAAVDDHATVCGACGAPIADATASFEPVATEPVSAGAAAQGVEGPVLVVRKGPQPGERFFVDRDRLTIGRDPQSDIFLNDMTVSRTHAVVSSDAGVVSIKDSGSLNGTYVNGVITDDSTLGDGDVVQIGTFQMVFFSGS